jgi:hypothetical protein
VSYGYVNPSTGFTIEVWFKSNAFNANYRALFNSRTQAQVQWFIGSQPTGNGRQMTMGLANGTGALTFQLVSETATSAFSVISFTDSAGAYAADNAWHHVAFRLSSNRATYTLFLDGAVLATGNATAQVFWNPSIQTFGAEYAPNMGDFGSNVWNKWLAYPVMFQKDLSDNRILEHYTAGSGGTVYYGDSEVTRLNRIADWAEVPDQSRDFETALVNLQGIQVAGTNALTAMQDTVGAANGFLFADGQSRIVYHNRRHSYNRWNIVTLAESVDAAPEVGVTFSVDDTYIFNDVRGDRPFGSEFRIVNDVSKASYGRKTYSFSLPVTTHEELVNAVAWIAARYREPVVRVSSMTFAAESSALIEWAATGGLTIGDHITLDELPGGAAPEVLMEFIVEKISLDVDIKNRTWRLNMELSPFEINEVFQIGVTPLGPRYRIAY